MNKDEQKFNQLTKEIICGYKAIDEIKYVISSSLVELETTYRNLSKFLTAKKSTPTIQHFLVEYLAKTYAQVIPVLRVGRYIKKQGISISDILEIPINKFEIVAKSGVEWTEDVKNDLLILGWNDTKIKYEKKKANKKTKS